MSTSYSPPPRLSVEFDKPNSNGLRSKHSKPPEGLRETKIASRMLSSSSSTASSVCSSTSLDTKDEWYDFQYLLDTLRNLNTKLYRATLGKGDKSTIHTEKLTTNYGEVGEKTLEELDETFHRTGGEMEKETSRNKICWVIFSNEREKLTFRKLLATTSHSNATVIGKPKGKMRNIGMAIPRETFWLQLDGKVVVDGATKHSLGGNREWADLSPSTRQGRVLELLLGVPEDLGPSSHKHPCTADAVILFHSLFSASDYKASLIWSNKLLKPLGLLLCFDFLLSRTTAALSSDDDSDAEDAKFKPIFQLLGLKIDQKKSFTVPHLKKKLDKYAYMNVSVEDLSSSYKTSVVERVERLVMPASLTAVKKEVDFFNGPGKVVLEPRIRDKDGFRRRAAAVIFRRPVASMAVKVPSPKHRPLLPPSRAEFEICVRKRRSKGWSFPGGGVERKETIEETIVRECWEECGVIGKPVGYYGCLSSPRSKTRTEVFLFESVEEREKYPEAERAKKWIPYSEMKHHFEQLATTEFFGEDNEASKEMLKLIWQNFVKIVEAGTAVETEI